MNVQQTDIDLVTMHELQIAFKFEVLNDNNTVLNVLTGVINGGTSNIESASDIRRSLSMTLVPTATSDLSITEDSLIWLNRRVHFYVGILNPRTENYRWYSQGYYVFSNTSGTYDATTHQLQLSCNDLVTLLDGTKNGQVGALTTVIPAYEENETTGEVIKYNYIREAMIAILKQMGLVHKYMIDDIGEYKAQSDYNPDWEQYRADNPLWASVPYDQEFSCGCSVWSIITTLRDLYPNYESFFDEDGVFICRMIPSCYYDDIAFDNDFIQQLLISESSSLDMTTVRNICEVWGDVIDADFYTEKCTNSNGIYTVSVDAYDKGYYTGDIIAVMIPSTNIKGQQMNINSYGNVYIYDENSEQYLAAGTLTPNEVHCFKVKKKYESSSKITTTKLYYLGQYQPHAINVCTNGTGSTEIYETTDGTRLTKYTKEYFQKVYNCDHIEFMTIPDSPFAIEKIGEILDVKNGGEYQNITSTSLAAARARWENWKNCRLTDNISLTVKLCPFLDVNKKMSYKRSDSNEVEQYIITAVSHSYDSFTSTITAYKFYPYYEPTDNG